MPVYDFNCGACGHFSETRPISQSSLPAYCPSCRQAAPKQFPQVNLRTMRSENRKAWERNERSAHAPHHCGPGCAHGSKPSASPAEPPKLVSSQKRNKRPWMLGH